MPPKKTSKTENLKKYLAIAVSILVLISAIVGANEYLAKASELELVSMRLDQKILNDRLYNLQNRVWAIEDRYGKDVSKMPENVRIEYRRLLREIEKIKRQLDSMKVN